MYTTAGDGGAVTEVNTRTLGVLRTFPVGGRPHGLAISADQTKLYVAYDNLGQVRVVDIAFGAKTSSVAVAAAFGITISPDGSTLFVTTNADKGLVMSASTLAISKSYDLNVDGRQVFASPDGTKAWTAT